MEEGKKFGNAKNIFCQEGRIISSVLCGALMTSDGWLKLAINTLVYRGGGVYSSGCGDMAVGTETNIWRRFMV